MGKDKGKYDDEFIETYSQTLDESERNEILKNYHSFAGKSGKDISDVEHNLNMVAQRKFKLLFWIHKHHIAICFAPVIFLVIFTILYISYFSHWNKGIFFAVIGFLFILFTLTKRIAKDATQKVGDYQYYIRQVAKKESRKKGK